MTDAILRNEADVHKYVGDEAIFTWPMRVGIRYENCLDLYFDIMERIKAHENNLKREFGVVPGVSCGSARRAGLFPQKLATPNGRWN